MLGHTLVVVVLQLVLVMVLVLVLQTSSTRHTLCPAHPLGSQNGTAFITKFR